MFSKLWALGTQFSSDRQGIHAFTEANGEHYVPLKLITLMHMFTGSS